MYESVRYGPPEGRIVSVGRGALSKVRLKTSSHRLELTAEQTRACHAACRRLRDKGATITDDPVYRVLKHRSGETLTLEVGQGTYAQVVGLKAHPEWGVKANVLAVCSVTRCPQGLVIEQRSPQVAAMPGRLHVVPAGSLHPPQTPWQALVVEAEEELGLRREEFSEPVCLGLIHVEPLGVFLLACALVTEVPLAEMESRQRSGAWEQSGLLPAPATSPELKSWLRDHREQLAPAALAAISLWAAERWGRGWLETRSGRS